MSRIRHAGENITVTTKGKETTYAKGNIELHSNKKVNIKGEEKGVSLGEPEKYEWKKKECTCKVSQKATTFKTLVALVKQAEEMLIENGHDEMGDRISCIRGIYYGTEWSMDYDTEKSKTRNNAFRIYTGSGVTIDARKTLKCSKDCKAKLFDSLYHSPEIFDNQSKSVDFGHLIIGLDSRRSWVSKNAKIPTQGGIGLEINTWLGDLGGGAGTLSNQRVKNPKKRAKTMFTSVHDYGATVNLEGDIAAYVVGMDEKNPSDIVDATDNFKTIHEALQDYFDKKWNRRAFYFLAMIDIGAKISGNNIVYIKNDIVEKCAKSIQDFSRWYIGMRMKDKASGGLEDFAKASANFKPVSEEIASIFIDGLLHVVKTPSDKITARTDPEPKLGEESTMNNVYKKANDLLKKAEGILENLKIK